MSTKSKKLAQRNRNSAMKTDIHLLRMDTVSYCADICSSSLRGKVQSVWSVQEFLEAATCVGHVSAFLFQVRSTVWLK